MAAINPSQLKSQVSGILKKYPEAEIIGLKSVNKWTQETVLSFESQPFLAVQCNSELAIREAVLKAKQEKIRLVFVTPLDDPDLGDDIRLKLAARRLIPIRPWESVKALFQARGVDGAVLKKVWLADHLIANAPAQGYAVAVSGFLTADRVWQEVLSNKLHFTTARPDAADIIEWSLDETHVSLLKNPDDAQFEDICDWIRIRSNALESLLLQFLKSGKELNLAALGLAFEVVTGKTKKDGSILREAAVRLEKYTGNKSLSPHDIRRFIESAKQVCQRLTANGRKNLISNALERLDGLLMDIGVQDFAWLSSVSPAGFEQRLVRFAETAETVLKNRSAERFEKLVQRFGHVNDHLASARHPSRMEQMRMAMRLIKWLSAETGHNRIAKSFAKAAEHYAEEGGFIDRARNWLRTGDASRPLNRLYMKLMRRVETIRDRQNERFAHLLKKWTQAGSMGKDLLKIEDFLDRVVAPIAGSHRLLLIVMDGMNHAVFSELKEDMIESRAWIELNQPDRVPQIPVIAALPTVTEVSRRSLLCGRLTADPKDDEHKGFSTHGKLCASSGAEPPILFLKNALAGTGGTYLSESVRQEIHSTRRKVIGVVLNNVDDFLYRGDQIAFSWKVDHLHVLSQLLHEAREADRFVIMTSDHGHVLDYHSVLYKCESGGRWRPDDGHLQEGEIDIRGSRVLKPDAGKMVAPFSEHIRYGKKNNGYHGGVTPQEVVIPWAVMKCRGIEKGWQALPFYQPKWWHFAAGDDEIPDQTDKAAGRKKPETQQKGQLSLFSSDDRQEPDEKTDWIDALLQSPIMISQKKLCGRAVLSDETIERLLKSLTEHGGTAMLSTLSQSMKQPPIRMPGIISKMQRILNIDGYQVLRFDTTSDTVTMNINLLKTQFKLRSV